MTRLMILRRVVFPEPLMPMSPSVPPGSTVEADVLQHPAVVPPDRLGERSTHAEELVVEERRRAVGAELLPHVLDADGPVRQCRQSSPPIA